MKNTVKKTEMLIVFFLTVTNKNNEFYEYVT